MSGDDKTIHGIVPGITPLYGNFAVETSADLPKEHTGRDRTGIDDLGRYR